MTENHYLTAEPGDFFCPTGGKWYACEAGTKFVGCCTSDPCVNHCVGDQLRPAGFSTRVYNRSPGGTCGGDTPFWTCTAALSFWGCCNEDPCKNNSTCPVGKLEPTVMNRPDQLDYFGDLNALMDQNATSTRSVTSSSTASATSTAQNVDSSGVSSAVIGGAVGGGVALLLIIAAAVFFLCRRKRRKQRQSGTEVGGQIDGAMAQNKGAFATSTSPQTGGLSPPPMYSPEQQAYYHVPQELPTEQAGSSAMNRYSELQGEGAVSRFSELPDRTVELSELESPQVSPKPGQTEFTPIQAPEAGHGLGVTMEEEGKRR